MNRILFFMLLSVLFLLPTTVDANEPVTGVTLYPSSVIIPIYGREQLIATVLPTNATNQNVTWNSNNTAVAIVTATGLVVGFSPGTAIITVMTEDRGLTASCVVTVSNQPASIVSMNKPSISIKVGETDQLEAVFIPDVIWYFTWSSSNPAVATVNAVRPELGYAHAIVTGISPGTATITATQIDGVGHATCEVTVFDDNDICVGCNTIGYVVLGFTLMFALLSNVKRII